MSQNKCLYCKQKASNDASLVLVVPDFGVFYACDSASCTDTFFELVEIAKDKNPRIYDATLYKGDENGYYERANS